MKNTVVTRYKWAYLPVVFGSATILATSAIAAPGSSQQYQDAKQVNTANYEYVGGKTQIGFGITDDGDASVDLNHVFSETENSSTSAGLWAGYDLHGDDKGIKGRGVQISHNWVARDKAGRATHVNKVFGAYDRDEVGHDKATVGYGREKENVFWEGHVSKGLSGKKGSRIVGGKTVSDRAYDYGVGGSIGKFIKGSNVRVRAGLDHEWGDDLGVGESRAKNTTLSAGIEKFFQGTPHSLGFDVSASKRSGGFDSGSDDTDVTSRLSYRYDFGGDIYQPNKRYKRTRVEVPGTPARYAKKAQFKRVPTYKTIPTYGKKTIRTPYKQLVKSTMELEGQTFFKLNSSKLIPSAQTRLKQIAAQIRKSGYKGSIRITGNTCGLGDPAYDQRLSEQRAKAVRNFLIKNGFNAKDLVARGLGKNHPKFPNSDEQGFKNRRVDIEYVSERKEYRTAYRTEQKTVRTGTRRVATGFKNVPAGYKNVLIGKAGAPRVIWKTEAIPTSPAWVKRALHNNIKHNTSVNTYQTTSGSTPATNNPKANGETVTLETCNSKVINVLANDDLGSGNVVVTITGNPSHGTTTVLADGSVRYTPNDDYVGTDSFTYTITDSSGKTSSATVNLTVTAQCQSNDAPVAVDDSATATKGGMVAINPLGNDSDPDGDTLTIDSVAPPAHGTAEIVGNQIIYRPDADFTGTETFTYTISDGNGHVDTATITVEVTAAMLPDANDDSITLETCNSKVVNVLANDNQGSGDAVVTVTGNASHGTTTVLADGSIRYTPSDDYVGDDSFTYTITDSNGNTSSATVSVTVTNQCSGNEAPIARNDATSTQVCDAVTIDVLKNDSDPDSDPLRILSVSGMSLGTAVILNNKILYTPSESCGTGIDNFSYTMTDDQDHTASANIRVEVKNDDVTLPPNVADDHISTDQGVGIAFNVLANDDADLMITHVTEPANGHVEKLSNGEISYLPNDGFHGKDSFSYTVKNAGGKTAQATVYVNVREVSAVNHAPVANQDSMATTVSEDIVLDVLANDTDADGDSLTIDSVTQPSQGATVSISNNKILFKPNGIAASNSFTYVISDGHGHTSETNVTVSVTDPNSGNLHWPLITNENVTTAKGTAITIDVLANDTDADGDTLILDQVDSGSNGTTHKVNGKVLYTPNPGFTGTDEFWYGVHDGHGHNGSGKVTVTVTP